MTYTDQENNNSEEIRQKETERNEGGRPADEKHEGKREQPGKV